MTENGKMDVTESVKKYYGKNLNTTDDLQTTACTNPAQKMPEHLRKVLAMIHDEIVSRYYGCGLSVPNCLEDMNMLDLGSGSGRDCYVLSKLVGENGFITGIDMTEEQIEVSNRHVDHHTKLFGFDKPNIKFVQGYIENLTEAGVQENSVDIIISNCVINLCKDKKKVLKEAYRVLKDGGELYFSDMYANRIASEEIRNNEVLWGEGLSGSLHWKQLYELAKEIGFEVPRTMTLSLLEVKRPDLKKLVGDTKYASILFRLFKLPSNAERSNCQATYNGTIQHYEKDLKLDRHYTFPQGKPVIVDGTTAAILKSSRFKDKFTFSDAPSCANPTPVGEEDPFEILAKGDDSSIIVVKCSKLE